MSLNISIVSAGNGPVLHVHGEEAGMEGVALGKGQVEGIYDAPTSTEWTRARRQRGGRYKGLENPERDITLGFHVISRGDSYVENDDLLRRAFTYELDPWYPGDTLARLVVDVEGDERTLDVQMSQEPEFAPEIDPTQLEYGNVFYRLKAAQPFWEGASKVVSWETAGTSGTGTLKLRNPCPLPISYRLVLTPGKWIIPDYQFTGPARKRTVAHARSIPLQNVTVGMGGLVIDTDPMVRTFRSLDGTNVNGQVAGGYYVVNYQLPPYLQPVDVPISVSGAPPGGARAELHYTELWDRPWGGF